MAATVQPFSNSSAAGATVQPFANRSTVQPFRSSFEKGCIVPLGTSWSIMYVCFVSMYALTALLVDPYNLLIHYRGSRPISMVFTLGARCWGHIFF